MSSSFLVRRAVQADHGVILAMYPRAFPDETLVWLVRELLAGGDEFVSLVAEQDGHVIGHVALNKCSVPGKHHKLVVLGPLAVEPDYQGSGIGRALIEESVVQMRDLGIEHMLVLGDPAYYGQFGFVKEDAVKPLYPLPEHWEGAWQGMALVPDAEGISGVIQVPSIWDDEALWTE